MSESDWGLRCSFVLAGTVPGKEGKEGCVLKLDGQGGESPSILSSFCPSLTVPSPSASVLLGAGSARSEGLT